MRPELNDDFRDMFECLEDAQVEYVVVGAHALAAHGFPRATGDIDILVRPSVENAVRVMAALERFGTPVRSHGVTGADFTNPGNVYQIGLPPRRIDLLTEISGVATERVFATRMIAQVGSLSLPMIGREALLENKRASGRPKDLADVAELEREVKA